MNQQHHITHKHTLHSYTATFTRLTHFKDYLYKISEQIRMSFLLSQADNIIKY